MPYYKSVPNLNTITIDYILQEGNKSCHAKYRNILNSYKFTISYKKVNSMKQQCNFIHSPVQ